jgi:quinol monooxygenase YgiN
MYSRIVNCTIDPSRMEKFRSELNGKFLPRIQAQPGFLENIESLDPATGRYCCVTLWKSAADVQRYDNGLFQEIATELGPLMQGAPSVETLPVENSSVHRIASGTAA